VTSPPCFCASLPHQRNVTISVACVAMVKSPIQRGLPYFCLENSTRTRGHTKPSRPSESDHGAGVWPWGPALANSPRYGRGCVSRGMTGQTPAPPFGSTGLYVNWLPPSRRPLWCLRSKRCIASTLFGIGMIPIGYRNNRGRGITASESAG
jgi:hypothetical protein